MKIPVRSIAVATTLLLITAILLIPLWKPGFPDTDDGTWMIIRLSAFYQSLAEGQFPVRFLGRLNHNYGYPVANFLYPGFLYLGSLFHLAGLTYVQSVKLILSLSLAGFGLCMFAWLRKTFRERESFLSVIGLLASPYILFDLYVRGSVGEILAMFAVSLVLVFLAYERIYLAGIAIAFLILSHNTIAILFLICLSFILFITRKWSWIRSIVAGLLISLFFWFPAISERKYVQFDTTIVSDPIGYFAVGKHTVLLPIISIISVVFGLIIRSSNKKTLVFYTYTLLCLASLFFALPASEAIWKQRIISGLVQFPYRFLAITGIFGSWLTAWIFSNMNSKYFRVAIPIYVVIIIIQAAVFLLNVSSSTYDETYYSTNEATTTVADEYMPIWVKSIPQDRTSSKIITINGSADISVTRMTSQVLDADIKASQNSVVQINTVYYPGWGITVDNVLQPIVYDNPYGFMQVTIPSGSHRLHAEFRETGPRFLTDLISVISVVATSIFAFFENRRWRKKL